MHPESVARGRVATLAAFKYFESKALHYLQRCSSETQTAVREELWLVQFHLETVFAAMEDQTEDRTVSVCSEPVNRAASGDIEDRLPSGR